MHTTYLKLCSTFQFGDFVYLDRCGGRKGQLMLNVNSVSTKALFDLLFVFKRRCFRSTGAKR